MLPPPDVSIRYGKSVDAITPRPEISRLRLCGFFLRIGLTSFGGLGATLAVIQMELVERRGLITTRQVTEALTFPKPLPGATAFQVVCYLGFQLGGWPGSAVAAVAFVSPPMVGMVGMAVLYDLVHELPRFPSVLAGLLAAVVGLLLATAFNLAKGRVRGVVSPLIAAVSCVVAVRFHVNSALIVAVGGLVGLVALMPPDASGP